MSPERTWDDLSYMKISLSVGRCRSLIVDLNKFHSRNAIVPRIVSVHPCTGSTYISVRKRLSLVTYSGSASTIGILKRSKTCSSRSFSSYSRASSYSFRNTTSRFNKDIRTYVYTFLIRDFPVEDGRGNGGDRGDGGGEEARHR